MHTGWGNKALEIFSAAFFKLWAFETGRLSCWFTKEKVGVSVGADFCHHLHGAVYARDVNRSIFQ